MRTLGLWVAASLLVSGWAVPVGAQDPRPAFTVSFSGELRVHGIVHDNVIDFRNTGAREGFCAGPPFDCKDSDSAFLQRFRLFTRIESADLKARVVWGLEIGDMEWGSGGGASGAEYGGTTSRTSQGSGGGLGADGVNVETKYLYLEFDVPGVKGASLLIGGHNIIFLDSPIGSFLDDDAFGIRLSWKLEPVSMQLWMAKADENARQDADDNDLYAARLSVDITKDLTASVEALMANTQCLARRAPVAPATTGTCISADFGETFWVGSTIGATLGGVRLDGSAVYGQRQKPCPTCPDGTASQRGWGVQATARVPLDPVSLWIQGWYTTGDARQRPLGGFLAGSPFDPPLERDSDKLPVPITGSSWITGPFVAEWTFGLPTLGNLFMGSPNYNDMTGTYGAGASATYALTPSLSVGAGVGFVWASDAPGIWGDHVVEVDVGVLYQYNTNLNFSLLVGYLVPGAGDDAWAAGWRARFLF
jgi:hypothetical protein